MENPPKYELVALGLKSGGALRLTASYLHKQLFRVKG